MRFIAIEKVDTARLPIVALGNYLQMGSDETGQVRQDREMELCLRSGILFVEMECGLNLLARNFEATGSFVFPFKTDFTEETPLAVVLAQEDNTDERIDGMSVVARSDYWQIEGRRRSFKGRVVLRAGFEQWGDIPDDLQHVVLKVSAIFYQDRWGGEKFSPLELRQLLEKYQPVRLGARP